MPLKHRERPEDVEAKYDVALNCESEGIHTVLSLRSLPCTHTAPPLARGYRLVPRVRASHQLLITRAMHQYPVHSLSRFNPFPSPSPSPAPVLSYSHEPKLTCPTSISTYLHLLQPTLLASTQSYATCPLPAWRVANPTSTSTVNVVIPLQTPISNYIAPLRPETSD